MSMPEPKRPRPYDGGVSTGSLGTLSVPPIRYGTSGGIPSTMAAMGMIAGGDVPVMNYGEPRRLNVKWEVPALYQSQVPLLKDIKMGDPVFIRPMQQNKFWFERKEGERGVQTIIGVSVRLLNKILYHRSMTEEYENITPTSVAREFRLGGVCHSDISETPNGSGRVLAANLTADNVIVRNQWDPYVACDDQIGYLITFMPVQPDVNMMYDAGADSILRHQYYNQSFGRKVNNVVRVVPFITRHGTSYPNRECAMSERDIHNDGFPEKHKNHFLSLGAVVRANFRLTKQAVHNPQSKRFNNLALPLSIRAFSEKDDKDNEGSIVEVRLNMV